MRAMFRMAACVAVASAAVPPRDPAATGAFLSTEGTEPALPSQLPNVPHTDVPIEDLASPSEFWHGIQESLVVRMLPSLLQYEFFGVKVSEDQKHEGKVSGVVEVVLVAIGLCCLCWCCVICTCWFCTILGVMGVASAAMKEKGEALQTAYEENCPPGSEARAKYESEEFVDKQKNIFKQLDVTQGGKIKMEDVTRYLASQARQDPKRQHAPPAEIDMGAMMNSALLCIAAGGDPGKPVVEPLFVQMMTIRQFVNDRAPPAEQM